MTLARNGDISAAFNLAESDFSGIPSYEEMLALYDKLLLGCVEKNNPDLLERIILSHFFNWKYRSGIPTETRKRVNSLIFDKAKKTLDEGGEDIIKKYIYTRDSKQLLFVDALDEAEESEWKKLHLAAAIAKLEAMCKETLQNGKYSSKDIFQEITNIKPELINGSYKSIHNVESFSVHERYPVGKVTLKEWLTIFYKNPEWNELRYIEGTKYLEYEIKFPL
jgi:hypothetical protein